MRVERTWQLAPGPAIEPAAGEGARQARRAAAAGTSGKSRSDYLRGRPLTSLSLLRSLLFPVTMVFALKTALWAYQAPFASEHLVLALLAFALAFPGRVPRTGSLAGVTASVIADCLMVFVPAALIGLMTQSLDRFDLKVMSLWVMLTALISWIGWRLLPRLAPWLVQVEGGRRRAVIAGAGSLGRQLASGMQDTVMGDVMLLGFFDDRGRDRPAAGTPGNKAECKDENRGQAPDLPMLGTIDELPDYARRHHLDLIYITLPMASQPRILKLLDGLRDTTASVYFTPDIFLADLIQARVDTVGGMPVIAVCETPFYGIFGPLKRISDIVLASLILLMIAPVMAAIAIAIRLESPGPVIFRQRRYGLDGREIVVYKFRSMTVTEDGGEIRQATKNDSRLTRLGGFLRRTSLDELPQFINVLQGGMSIVGPRPHAVAHNELYRQLIDGYMLRHKVKPGITGWAQVNGLRGETETVDKMRRRVEFDLDYLRHWSLRWDLEIILKTLLVAWKKQNAY